MKQYGVTLYLNRHEDGSVAGINLFFALDDDCPTETPMQVATTVREILREMAAEEDYKEPEKYVQTLFGATWDHVGGTWDIIEHYGFSARPFTAPIKGWYSLSCIDDWVSFDPEEYAFQQEELAKGPVSLEIFDFQEIP